MVRMTGFEPTRLSTLEPETSASAVPPHPHIRLKEEVERRICHFLFRLMARYKKSSFNMISQSKEFVKVFVKGFLGYADFLSDFSAKCGVNMLYRTESAAFGALR